MSKSKELVTQINEMNEPEDLMKAVRRIFSAVREGTFNPDTYLAYIKTLSNAQIADAMQHVEYVNGFLRKINSI